MNDYYPPSYPYATLFLIAPILNAEQHGIVDDKDSSDKAKRYSGNPLWTFDERRVRGWRIPDMRSVWGVQWALCAIVTGDSRYRI